MKFKIGKKYEVRWTDTFSYNGWYSGEEIKKKSEEAQEYINSTGYFVGEYYGFIILCSQYAPDTILTTSPFGHPNWIPKGCIKKIKTL